MNLGVNLGVDLGLYYPLNAEGLGRIRQMKFKKIKTQKYETKI